MAVAGQLVDLKRFVAERLHERRHRDVVGQRRPVARDLVRGRRTLRPQQETQTERRSRDAGCQYRSHGDAPAGAPRLVQAPLGCPSVELEPHALADRLDVGDADFFFATGGSVAGGSVAG